MGTCRARGKGGGGVELSLSRNLAGIVQMHFPVHHVAEQARPVAGTDRDEIRPRLGAVRARGTSVVLVSQAVSGPSIARCRGYGSCASLTAALSCSKNVSLLEGDMMTPMPFLRTISTAVADDVAKRTPP